MIKKIFRLVVIVIIAILVIIVILWVFVPGFIRIPQVFYGLFPSRAEKIILKAQRTENVLLCDKLKREENKEQCIANIAIKTNDPELCSRLSERASSSLPLSLETLLPRHGFEVSNFPLKGICYTAIAEGTKDPELCHKGITPTLKDSCFERLAVLVKDEQLCHNISKEESPSLIEITVNNCIEHVKDITIPSYCNTISSTGIAIVDKERKNICLSRAAKEFEDIGLCERIENDTYSSKLCKVTVCEKQQDVSCCQQLGSNSIPCITHIAADTENRELCDLLGSDFRKQCLDYIERIESP